MWMTALKGLGSVFGSTKFLIVMCIVCALVFAKVQIGNYIDHEIKQNTAIISKTYENEGLRFQIKTMQENQAIAKEETDKAAIVRQSNHTKSETIRKKINEEVKNGNDGLVSPLLANVIDSL